MQITRELKHFMDVHYEHLKRGFRPKGNDLRYMSDAKMGNSSLSLHYGVFSSTLRSQARHAHVGRPHALPRPAQTQARTHKKGCATISGC